MKKSVTSLLATTFITTLLFTGCSSHKEALKVLPNELSIADECRNTNKSFEYDCYDLISYKNTFAQIRLGIKAQKEGNNEEAYNRYMLAKSKGNFYANALLADMFNKGLFVKQNKDTVIDLLEDVDQVDPMAAYKLAFLYIADKDYKDAIKLLEFAATNDLKDAQNELSKIYSEGKITPTNLERSKFWSEQYQDKTKDYINKIYGL